MKMRFKLVESIEDETPTEEIDNNLKEPDGVDGESKDNKKEKQTPPKKEKETDIESNIVAIQNDTNAKFIET